MIKLIASDMDGTLLNQHNEVSEENAKKVKEAMDLGMEFVAVTGRPFESAHRLLAAAGIESPLICLNGANTFTKQGKLVRSAKLAPEMITKVRKLGEELGVYTVYFTDQGVFTSQEDAFKEELAQTFLKEAPGVTDEQAKFAVRRFLKEEQVQFITDDAMFNSNMYSVYKMLAFSKTDEKLSDMYRKLESDPNLAISSSASVNLEINHIEAEKGIALKHYVENQGIPLENVMAIGDNLNDVSMLKLVGRGVAMGNAIDAVKNICNYSTKKNTENGVANAIEEMLQEQKINS